MDGKHILLGVTGGIAAYKSPDLVRRLIERGAQVQVVMTAGAREFVSPLTFQAVSGREVRSDLWDESAERAMSHIELARWADLVLIAPATADFIAHLSHGLADNLLATVCLATSAPVAIAPAMNQQMWANAATQANVATLRARGVHVFGPGSGSQACGEVGEGRMMEPVDIAAAAFGVLPAEGPLKGRKVLITAGPTRERIDPVRFISNRSSGKMGYAVAQAARDRGAEVVLVSGPVNLCAPPGVRRVCVESAAQMYDAVMREVDDADIFIATAAVADYRPAAPANIKIKKVNDCLEVRMERTIDILAAVAQRERRPYTVGFAAETNDIENHALAKLTKKNLDLIAANEVGDNKVFEQDDNSLVLLWPGGGRQELGAGAKTELAVKLVDFIVARVSGRCDVTDI
ncbi:MAG: bifunctional phosphopantothenoylcysteine decarboxylase/phosphopantothenate--cysteine ligase CoaBC [Nevskiaceae bacterium]|jgi:phosphopantothenoylcysteine decarboxylase/phosphopantothenate--cysteine ligase|nr:bifunctional phosphopantothenoylcysteine decarboxylase/phosphopantothenate--cysteine ligase CoaBC [Nevskiaceae bacterium]